MQPSTTDQSHPDIRLIVADMDGTLLDSSHRLPTDFWPVLAELKRRGIQFCPASGRQYYSLLRVFAEGPADLDFIAENGTFIVHQGSTTVSDTLSLDDTRRLVASVRNSVVSGADAGIVVCGRRSAYIERADEAYRVEVDRYYARLEVVGNLEEVHNDEILKVAIFDFGQIEDDIVPSLTTFVGTHLVSVSGQHWVDVMNPGANKGNAIRHLQASLDISPAQTMAFGDYLNDLQMMGAADFSYAMANGHPDLQAAARFQAPSNDDNGVLQTIVDVLGGNWPGTNLAAIR